MYINFFFLLDERSFYGTMVKHIHGLLKQRDVTYGPKSNWVLTEAMNLRKLHMGGTFKNALAKKVDEVVIPLFAQVIAIIDRNQNLNHLKDLGKKQCSVHDLWLQIFNSPNVLDLDYEQLIRKEKVPVADDNFQCKFPFSWIVKEAIDNLWESTRNTTGNGMNCTYPIDKLEAFLLHCICYCYNYHIIHYLHSPCSIFRYVCCLRVVL